MDWYKGHFLQIVALELFKEMWGKLQSIRQNFVKTLLERYFFYSNQISKSHYCPNLQSRRMDEHFPSLLYRILYESVWQPEVFLSILFIIVVEINIEVLKILVSFCILFGSHIEYVCDSKFE